MHRIALWVLLVRAAAATRNATVAEGRRVAKPILRGGALDAASQVRALAGVNRTRTHSQLKEVPACNCETSNGHWKKTTRTQAKCIFIDLGAADGNTFEEFLKDGYGPVSGCPNGAYEAWLVEANPRFAGPLKAEETKHPGQVHAMPSTAAWMCEATTSFWLDTKNVANNYWGSSMSQSADDWASSPGKKNKDNLKEKVTVPTNNLVRLLYEKTIPADWVMVKMDIEGAEWSVVPCLAKAKAATLIDRLYLEEHPQSWQVAPVSASEFQAAKATLKQRKVDIPDYFTNSL